MLAALRQRRPQPVPRLGPLPREVVQPCPLLLHAQEDPRVAHVARQGPQLLLRARHARRAQQRAQQQVAGRLLLAQALDEAPRATDARSSTSFAYSRASGARRVKSSAASRCTVSSSAGPPDAWSSTCGERQQLPHPRRVLRGPQQVIEALAREPREAADASPPAAARPACAAGRGARRGWSSTRPPAPGSGRAGSGPARCASSLQPGSPCAATSSKVVAATSDRPSSRINTARFQRACGCSGRRFERGVQQLQGLVVTSAQEGGGGVGAVPVRRRRHVRQVRERLLRVAMQQVADRDPVRVAPLLQPGQRPRAAPGGPRGPARRGGTKRRCTSAAGWARRTSRGRVGRSDSHSEDGSGPAARCFHTRTAPKPSGHAERESHPEPRAPQARAP